VKSGEVSSLVADEFERLLGGADNAGVKIFGIHMAMARCDTIFNAPYSIFIKEENPDFNYMETLISKTRNQPENRHDVSADSFRLSRNLSKVLA
jgi:hypothetical protein